MNSLGRTDNPNHKIGASGGWKPGDPPAWRKFFDISERPFALESGARLEHITVAYETWGELNEAGSNAILLCHALTGDAHAAGQTGPGQKSAGWWDELIGPGKALDSDRFFIVCTNVLGGCGGTTGPAHPHPDDHKPYGSRFPVVSVRDTVRTQAALAAEMGVNKWALVIGASAGGMTALEWAVMYPDRVGSLACIASAAQASPLQIAWSEIGRLAIANDPKWRGGDYYDAADGDGPHEGLMLARRVAQVHYRSGESFESRFGRELVDPAELFGFWDRFQIESYLDYHGLKLAKRFDANSYLILNKAMDLHDVGRGRGGVEAAMGRISCPTFVVSVDSDTLYPPHQQVELCDLLAKSGTTVEYHVIESENGHDGFLIEFDQFDTPLAKFVESFCG